MSINLTPAQIVEELDKHIIGQSDAKRAVAIALRNRWRRKQVNPDWLAEEILPKNILMIGSTGVGKTEISRRLAKLAGAPFIKVEATKYTEVGYVGREVDSMVRDLMEVAVSIVRKQKREEVKERASIAVEERILNVLVGEDASSETKEKFRTMLRAGELNDKEIEIDVAENTSSSMPTFDLPGMPGVQGGVFNISDIIGKATGETPKKKRHLLVEEAQEILMNEESDNLIDEDSIIQEAIKTTENDGIIFLDEIDKICSRSDVRGEVSREGVQRDLLPLLEGSSITTKYGTVKTDHILFIASGAFHLAKPADLLPELQGRLPIRVELRALTKDDLLRVLKEPKANLVKQYSALMETEEVALEFTEEGLEEIAQIATRVNRDIENIGARRLHTLMEKLLEEISFIASENAGMKVVIDQKFVQEHLGDLTGEHDLAKFIL